MSIDIKVADDVIYHTLELHFSDDVPVWDLLDTVATWFEENEHDTAIINAMSTEFDAINDTGLLLTVIWSE